MKMGLMVGEDLVLHYKNKVDYKERVIHKGYSFVDCNNCFDHMDCLGGYHSNSFLRILYYKIGFNWN